MQQRQESKPNIDWHCVMCLSFILGDCQGKENICSKYKTLKERIKW